MERVQREQEAERAKLAEEAAKQQQKDLFKQIRESAINTANHLVDVTLRKLVHEGRIQILDSEDEIWYGKDHLMGHYVGNNSQDADQ